MRFRIEEDKLGQLQIPQEAYYGIGTIRSKEAFQLTKHGLSRQMIKSLALVKKVAALTNKDLKVLDSKLCDCIALSCDEILNGRLHGQFLTDVLQDGYGYGMDANSTEVVCNRANEMLGGKKGEYTYCKLTDVNMLQDIKETVVLAGKLTSVKLTKKLIAENKKAFNAISNKIDNKKISKDSEVYLQFQSVVETLKRDTKRVDKAMDAVKEFCYGQYINLDGLDKNKYLDRFIYNLNENATEKYTMNRNYYSASNNLECFMTLSASIKNLMINFSRSMSDLKEITKQGKIVFPNVQDINVSAGDLLFDFVKQVSFYIVGNDLTISRAIEAGVLNDNPFIPVVLASLFESINLVRRTIRTIKEKVFEIMEINE